MQFLKLTAMAIAALGISMGISFYVVRHLAREMPVVRISDEDAAKVAPLLRELSNDLLACANDYFSRIPLENAKISGDARAWSEATLLPRLDTIIARALEGKPSSPQLADLAAAAQRARLMVRNPENLPLRRQAAIEISMTTEAAEAFIARHNAGAFCREGPMPMRFDIS